MQPSNIFAAKAALPPRYSGEISVFSVRTLLVMQIILQVLVLWTALFGSLSLGKKSKGASRKCKESGNVYDKVCHRRRLKRFKSRFVNLLSIEQKMIDGTRSLKSMQSVLEKLVTENMQTRMAAGSQRGFVNLTTEVRKEAENSTYTDMLLTASDALAESLSESVWQSSSNSAASVMKTLIPEVTSNLQSAVAQQITNENVLISRVSWYLIKYFTLLRKATAMALSLSEGRGSASLVQKDVETSAILNSFFAKFDQAVDAMQGTVQDAVLAYTEEMQDLVHTGVYKNTDDFKTYAAEARIRFGKTLTQVIAVAKKHFQSVVDAAARDSRLSQPRRAEQDNYSFEAAAGRINTTLAEVEKDVHYKLDGLEPIMREKGADLYFARQAILDVVKSQLLPEVQRAIQEASDWQVSSTGKAGAIEMEIEKLKARALQATKSQNFTDNMHVLGLTMLIDKTGDIEQNLKEETQAMKQTIVDSVSDLAKSLGVGIEHFVDLMDNYEAGLNGLYKASEQSVAEVTELSTKEAQDLSRSMLAILDGSAESLALNSLSSTDQLAKAEAAAKLRAGNVAADAKRKLEVMSSTRGANSADFKYSGMQKRKAATTEADIVNQNLDKFAKLSRGLLISSEAMDRQAAQAESQAAERAASLADTTNVALGDLNQRVLAASEKIQEGAEKEMNSVVSGYMREVESSLRRVYGRISEQKKRNEANQKKIDASLTNFGSSGASGARKLTKAQELIDGTQARLDLTQTTSLAEAQKQLATLYASKHAIGTQNDAFAEKNAEIQRTSSRQNLLRKLDSREGEIQRYVAAKKFTSAAEVEALQTVTELKGRGDPALAEARTLAATARTNLGTLDSQIANSVIGQRFRADVANAEAAIDSVLVKKLVPAVDAVQPEFANRIEGWKTATSADLKTAIQAILNERGPITAASADVVAEQNHPELDTLIGNFSEVYLSQNEAISEELVTNSALFTNATVQNQLQALLLLMQDTLEHLHAQKAESDTSITGLASSVQSQVAGSGSSLSQSIEATNKAIKEAETSGKLGLTLGFGGLSGDAKLVGDNVALAKAGLGSAVTSMEAARAEAGEEYASIVKVVNEAQRLMQSGTGAALKELAAASKTNVTAHGLILDASIGKRIEELMQLWDVMATESHVHWPKELFTLNRDFQMDALGQKINDLAGRMQVFINGEAARGYSKDLRANVNVSKRQVADNMKLYVANVTGQIDALVEGFNKTTASERTKAASEIAAVRDEIRGNLKDLLARYAPFLTQTF